VMHASRAVLTLPKPIRHIRFWVGGAVEDFCTVHRQSVSSFRERSFHADYTADASDLGVSHRKESVQIFPIKLDPLVPHVVWHRRVFAGKNLELVVFVNHFTTGRNDERAVNEFLSELGMLELRLRDDVGIVLIGFAAKGFV